MVKLEHQSEQQQNELKPVHKSRNNIKLVLNVLIAVSLVVVIYFGYAFVSQNNKSAEEEQKNLSPPRIIQLDVLNGCGAKGIGSRFTDYLRAKGFDVVEMKNYKSFQITHTLVVDRIGDLSIARKVAAALGVSERNIVQQINPDYFVDVSVIIGKDYSTINLLH